MAAEKRKIRIDVNGTFVENTELNERLLFAFAKAANSVGHDVKLYSRMSGAAQESRARAVHNSYKHDIDFLLPIEQKPMTPIKEGETDSYYDIIIDDAPYSMPDDCDFNLYAKKWINSRNPRLKQELLTLSEEIGCQNEFIQFAKEEGIPFNLQPN